MYLKRIKQLENEVSRLRQKIDALDMKVRVTTDVAYELKKNFNERVSSCIKNKIYFQTIEDIRSYEKGKKIKEELGTIKEELKIINDVLEG